MSMVSGMRAAASKGGIGPSKFLGLAAGGPAGMAGQFLGELGVKTIFKGIKSLFNRGAEKRKAKNAQAAAQYRVNQKQKGLNRKGTNFASLLKSLKREGWYGPEYQARFGTPNLADWSYDQVPLEAGQGLMGAAGEGLLGGAEDYFNDAAAARADAEARIRAGRA